VGRARIRACGFSNVTDTLTITSMLPGVDDIIGKVPYGVARTGHTYASNMS
jgi:hypothetical protein